MVILAMLFGFKSTGRIMEHCLDADLQGTGAILSAIDALHQRFDLHLQDCQKPSDTVIPASAFPFENDKRVSDDPTRHMVRCIRPALPDPRLIRRIIRQRQIRQKIFGDTLFADPAWDMLLDLCAARAEHNRVSVTSLCIASGVAPTTALRWINVLVKDGLFVRVEDEMDRRRAFIALSEKASDMMAKYFAELGSSARDLV